MPNIFLFKRLDNFEHGAKSDGALSEFFSVLGLQLFSKGALVGLNVLNFFKAILKRICKAFFIYKEHFNHFTGGEAAGAQNVWYMCLTHPFYPSLVDSGVDINCNVVNKHVAIYGLRCVLQQ